MRYCAFWLTSVPLAFMLAAPAQAQTQTQTQIPNQTLAQIQWGALPAAGKVVPYIHTDSPPAITALSEKPPPVVEQASNALPKKEQEKGNKKGAPIKLTADSIERNQQAGTITARGHVELEQTGRTLHADEVVYNIATDHVTAHGHVELVDQNGDRHFADSLDLTDRMRDGAVHDLRTTMEDGSRFKAKTGHRIAGKTTTMEDASYTPCKPCKTHPNSPPPWQIKASEVRHDVQDHKITYKNATFDVLGVPVMYMPYFSHPDGTIKQKSGLLTPSFGYKSRQGAMLTNSYYYALAPYADATLGVTAMSAQDPLVFGEYRRRFGNARLKLNGSMTYASRVDDTAGVDVIKGERLRGHFFAKGLWDINDNWRAGLDAAYASDDQYLKQYDFSNKDILESQLYLERFAGRDYAVARMMSFQDLRILTERTDQPDVLPQVEASFLGDPGQTLGGRWSFDTSLLGLLRDGSGQDMDRLSVQAGWQRRFMTDFGLLTLVDLTAREDGYFVHDRTPAVTGLDDTGTATRGFAQGNVTVSYPLAKRLAKSQIVITPTAAMSVAPDVNANDPKIPNEDSQDVQLDASNIFEPNRFPGEDRVEDKSHITYGVRTGIYGDDGSKGEVFLGQSYRFDAGDNPFPTGSGLSRQSSDLVGQILASYQGRFSLDYKFDLDSADYRPNRHEVNLSMGEGPVSFSTTYVYARPIAGTTLTQNREQIAGSAQYNLTDEWHVRASATEDLGEEPGLRAAQFGLDYIGQCYTLSGNLQRNLTDDSSGYSNTVLMFRVGLKNLGAFSTSGISLGTRSSSTTTGPDL